MFHPPIPLDSTYIIALAVGLAISAGLFRINAHPAWHALALAVLFGAIGQSVFYTHMQTIDLDDVGAVLSMTWPAPLTLLGVGKTLAIAALWLAVFRHWLGPKTKVLCIAALWVIPAADALSYLGQMLKTPMVTLPDLDKVQFLTAIAQNQRIQAAMIAVTLFALIAVLTLFAAPLIWRLLKLRKGPVSTPR